jgi:GT2 family glycosyltransferase
MVTVVVLSYKRLDELERCLDSIRAQDYPRIETIVVDNHSEENVAGVVQRYGDGVRLIELPANLGPCGGRNAGIRAARGTILITLDNDVRFATPAEVSRTVEAFDAHPDYHVLAFRICDAGSGKLRIREWCHPRDWRRYHQTEFETSFFGEGASAYRREVFEEAGLYWEPLFIGCEGWDLGLRILSHGFRILYCPAVSVLHSMSAETRAPERPFYFYTRNYIWIAYKDYRLWAGLRYLLPKLLMMLLFSLRAARPRAFLRGMWDGVRALPAIFPRTPMGRDASATLARLESTRPNLVRRLQRHSAESQL